MSRIVCLSVSAAGADLATRLPYEHRTGRLVDLVREEWDRCEGLVLIGATGIAVRAVAPLLDNKASDPAVVTLDDSGRFAVALVGGHQAGANRLAREVAAHVGAVPVITTATDGVALPALDQIPGYRAAGDVAGVTRRWLDGSPPSVVVDPALPEWPLPPALAEVKAPGSAASGGLVTITDAARQPEAGEVLLRPSTVLVGVGSSSGADPAALELLTRQTLHEAGLAPEAVEGVATLDRKTGEPAIRALATALGVELVSFPAPTLASVDVPNPSAAVAEAVGTASVAEAAARWAAGPGARLVAEKRVSSTGDSTVALARRSHPVGHLAVVGLGPGRPSAITGESAAAVRHAEVVVGYTGYIDLAGHLLGPAQDVRRSPLGAERQRCEEALRLAASGRRVALVCSGDPGVYAMASLALELAPAAGDPPVTVLPGVTAAQSAAALLGAPLGHDHAAVSLSDLLTPWDVIVRRLEAVAEADFVVSLYNPRSRRRTDQLPTALRILRLHRPDSTPVAVVANAGRPGERITRATLSTVDPDRVDMLSLVMVGSSQSRWIGDRMVTPRGYATS